MCQPVNFIDVPIPARNEWHLSGLSAYPVNFRLSINGHVPSTGLARPGAVRTCSFHSAALGASPCPAPASSCSTPLSARSTIACRRAWRSSRARSWSRLSGRASWSGRSGSPSGCRPRRSATTGFGLCSTLTICRRSPRRLRRLIEWTADYYLAPLAAVLRMALPSSGALEGARSITEYRATGHVPDRLTPQRAQALERIGDRQGLVSELAIIGGVSDGVIRGLVKAGAIEAVEVAIDDPFPIPDPDHDPPALEPAQDEGGGRASRRRRRRATSRLTCSTASPARARPRSISKRSPRRSPRPAGACPAPRDRAHRALPQALRRPLRLRSCALAFGPRQSQRRRAWRAIAGGEARVVVGARSALSCPIRSSA